MRICQCFVILVLALSSLGCGLMHRESAWKIAVANHVGQLGYHNWIVIAEASLPAQNNIGIRQVSADVGIPEALDYVLNTIEKTQHVRPQLYLTRELRSLENDFAPGIDEHRKRVRVALHSYETMEIEQQSLLTLLQDANRSYDVLVIRTPVALPYTSVFLELKPGYWDAESETRLRERISRERREKLAKPGR